MSKFKPEKFYISREGRTSMCWISRGVENRIMERDYRKMLFEVSKRGDVHIFFKDKEIHLTKEQFQQISELWKTLIIWQ